MSLREPAWRVLASELIASLEEERGSGERAASYVLSPYGARMNRVLLAGTLSTPEMIGKDPAQPFWRSRLVDPSGIVDVTAGGYQLRASSQLKALGGPQTAIVVGKVRLFHGNDGVGRVSVRAEAIRGIDEPELRARLGEALGQTLERLDLLARLSREPPAPEEELLAAGIPAPWVRAARESRRRYPSIDREAFRSGLKTVLAAVDGSGPARPPPPARLAPIEVTPVSVPPPPRPTPSAAERAEESSFLDLMDELAEASTEGYADLKELSQRLAGQGLSADRAETLLDRLEEAGTVEEPIVGKLRRP